jgi:hypothetical protein
MIDSRTDHIFSESFDEPLITVFVGETVPVNIASHVLCARDGSGRGAGFCTSG